MYEDDNILLKGCNCIIYVFFKGSGELNQCDSFVFFKMKQLMFGFKDFGFGIVSQCYIFIEYLYKMFYFIFERKDDFFYRVFF